MTEREPWMRGLEGAGPLQATGRMGNALLGASVQLEWAAGELEVSMRVGLGVANLMQGASRVLRISAEVEQGALLLRPSCEAVPVWRNFFSPRRVEHLLESGVAGEVTDTGMLLTWAQDNSARCWAAHPFASTQHWQGEVDATSGLWRTPERLAVNFLASPSRLRGRFGLPHPAWGQDVDLSGNLPAPLMVLGAALAGWLMFCETGEG